MPTPQLSPSVETVLAQLRRLGTPAHRASKARLGAPPEAAFGVTLGDIRALGKRLGRNHDLALGLWDSGYHEARLLAALVADPHRMTAPLAERWLGDVVSWDLCDHLCNNLLLDVPACIRRIPAWAGDNREFVRRAAFALIASHSIHHSKDEQALVPDHLKLVRMAASDSRAYVKKAVSWALREIGKRERDFGALDSALKLARELAASENAAERWVGKDAVKALEALVAVPGRRRLAPKARPSARAKQKS